ncbi:MAG: hypothetical protein HAW61_05650 [Candidatus Portiera sp.]|nr:hypothetical protein [Portiera sp.]
MSKDIQHLDEGSIWRKWDLQIHVPESEHGDQYKTRECPEPWIPFLELLRASDVEVFGITDYFTIDGYNRFMEKIDGDPILKKKVYFPNIEFRIDKHINKDGEAVNLHVIFDNSPEVIDKIPKCLSKVKIILLNGKTTAEFCTLDTLRDKGYDNILISQDDLISQLNDAFTPDQYLIAATTGYGSIRSDSKSSTKRQLADTIEEKCHMILGSEKNTDYFLGNDRYEDKSIKAKAKPVFDTSDCHSIKNCEENLGQKFSWIKADTTFEGLRQTLYEPKDRVSIGPSNPNNKRPYHVIKKIRFIDESEKEFIPEYIPINPNLTTIIGGKSTGKSLLLYNISNSIDPELTKERHGGNKPYQQTMNFEVEWADKSISSTIAKNNNDNNNKKKILYIPQSYLSQLSDKNTINRDAINVFTTNIMLQDPSKKDKYNKHKEKINTLEIELSDEIVKFFQTQHHIKELEEAIKGLGNKKAIQAHIDLMNKNINDMKKQSGLSNEKIERYQNLTEKRTKQSSKVSILKEDLIMIKEYNDYLGKTLRDIEQEHQNKINSIESVVSKKLFTDLYHYLSSHNKELINKHTIIVAGLEENFKKEDIVLKRLREQIQPILNEMKEQEKIKDDLDNKTKRILEDTEKLDKLNRYQSKLKTSYKHLPQRKDRIISIYKEIYNSYSFMVDIFNKDLSEYDDIVLKYQVTLSENKFNEDVIEEFINKKDIKKVIKDRNILEEYYYKFKKESHLGYINKVFEGLIEKEISTIKNRSIQDATVKLFGDYFNLFAEISYKNDKLEVMSPGKKGIALLKILLELNNEEWPILIDQPEDDLDNRSIYDELVNIIKDKKKERQIIIVTHNPNLVIGTDAEEIIVANQAGQETTRENVRYKFEYKSGAIENNKHQSKSHAVLQKKWMREHVCEVLEGGKEAFQKREDKYHLDK